MKHKKFLAILLSILALTFLSVGCSIDSEEEASILEVSELSVELGLYEEHTITAANPAGELSWKSSDETVVTVDGGVLYAVGAGTAKITVNDGVFTAFIDVTVTDDGTAPVLTAPEALSVEYGKTVTITPTYTFKGEAAENVTYTYESGDEEIVTVDENGVVTGVKQGEATVTVKANWKTAEELTKEVKITVEDIDFGYIFANGKLSGGKATLVYATEESGSLTIGEVYATVDGVATTDELEMIWLSENEDVITVNNGVIEAVAVGTATVRGRAFYADQERVITLAVTVEKGITLTAEESVMEFDEITLTAKTKAEGAIVWASSDETVATVDENGVVTGVKPGTANITATLGKDSAVCALTVTETNVPHVIVLDKEALEIVYGEKGSVTPSITFKGETLTGYDVQYVWALESGVDVANIEGNEFTAKAVGEGVYKLTATVRGKTAEKELTVTVTQKVEEIETEYTLEVAGSRKATAMTMPEGINAADVEKLTVNGEVVYTKGEVNGQNVPVSNLPVAVDKLGEGKEVRIETANVVYLAKANLYTMIITTAEELDAWQEMASENAVATGLINAKQKGAKMSGYFVLGNDIAYNKVYRPYKTYGEIWGLVSGQTQYGAMDVDALINAGEENVIKCDWGDGSMIGFVGTFDGKGHVIDGMKIEGQYNAFVVTMNKDGYIKNVAFTNAVVEATNSLVVKAGGGNFENIYVEYAKLSGSDVGTTDEVSATFWRNGALNYAVTIKNVVIDLTKAEVSGRVVSVGNLNKPMGIFSDIYVVGNTEIMPSTTTDGKANPAADERVKAYADYAAFLAENGEGVKEWSAMWKNNGKLFLPASVYAYYDKEIAFKNQETQIGKGAQLTLNADGRWVEFSLAEAYEGVSIDGNVLSIALDAPSDNIIVVATSLVNAEKTARLELAIKKEITIEGEQLVALNRNALVALDLDDANETFESVYVNGEKADGVSAEIAEGKLTLNKAFYAAMDRGVNNIKVLTDKSIYSYSAKVVDYAVATLDELKGWWNANWANARERKSETHIGEFGDVIYDRTFIDDYIVIEADIDATGYDPGVINLMSDATKKIINANGDTTNYWYDYVFTGTIEGNGHVINGLRGTQHGFMRALWMGGVVKDLSLTGMWFSGSAWACVFSNSVFGTLENCYFEIYGNTSYGEAGIATSYVGDYGRLANVKNVVAYIHDRRAGASEKPGISGSIYGNVDGLYVVNTQSNGTAKTNGINEGYYFYNSIAEMAAAVTEVPAGFGDEWTIFNSGLLMTKKAAAVYEAKYGANALALTTESEYKVNQDIVLAATLGGASANVAWAIEGLAATDYTLNGNTLVVTNTALNGTNFKIIATIYGEYGIYRYTADKQITLNGIIERHTAEEYKAVDIDMGLKINTSAVVEQAASANLDITQIYNEKMAANAVAVTVDGVAIYNGVLAFEEGADKVLALDLTSETFVKKGSRNIEVVFAYSADGVNYEYHLPVIVKAEVEINNTITSNGHNMSYMDAAKLKSILESYPAATYNFTGNLDMKGGTLKVVNEFSGVINGNGYAITNAVLHYITDAENNNYMPRFIRTNNGIIRNLSIEITDFNFDAGNGRIGLVHVNNGTIDNVYLSMVVKTLTNSRLVTDTYDKPADTNSGVSVAGLVQLNNGTISNCVVNMSRTSENNVVDNTTGLIAFENQGTVAHSYAVLNNMNAKGVMKGKVEGFTEVADMAALFNAEDFSAEDGWNSSWRYEYGGYWHGQYSLEGKLPVLTYNESDKINPNTKVFSGYTIDQEETEAFGSTVYKVSDMVGVLSEGTHSKSAIVWTQKDLYRNYDKIWFAAKATTAGNFLQLDGNLNYGFYIDLPANTWLYFYIDFAAGKAYYSFDKVNYTQYKDHPYFTRAWGDAIQIFNMYRVHPTDTTVSYDIYVSDYYCELAK